MIREDDPSSTSASKWTHVLLVATTLGTLFTLYHSSTIGQWWASQGLSHFRKGQFVQMSPRALRMTTFVSDGPGISNSGLSNIETSHSVELGPSSRPVPLQSSAVLRPSMHANPQATSFAALLGILAIGIFVVTKTMRQIIAQGLPASEGIYPVSLQSRLRDVCGNMVETQIPATRSWAMSSLTGQFSAAQQEAAKVALSATEEGKEADDSNDTGMGSAELIKFALPALGIVLVNPLMTVIDNTFVGLASSAQVAAMGPSTILLDFPAYLFYFLSVATTNLISTRIAQQVPPATAAKEVLAVSMRLGILTGLLLLGFVSVSKMAVLTAVGARAEVIPHALSYIGVRMWWLPFGYLVTTTQSSLMATKDSVSPLKAIAVSGLVNALGDFVLCQMFGMGLVGAGIATVVAQFVLLGLLLNTARQKGFLPSGLLDIRQFPTLEQAKPVLSFAPPLVLSVALRLAGYTILTGGAAGLGTLPLAAHQILVGLYLFFSLVGDVLNLTSQTMLPKFLTGTSQSVSKARALIGQLGGMALALGAVTGTLMVTLITQGSSLLTRDTVVMAHMASAAGPIAVALLATPLAIVLESVLICTKDFRTLLFSSLSSTVLMYFTMTSLVHSAGLAGVWWAVASSFSVRAVLASLRIFFSGSLVVPSSGSEPGAEVAAAPA